MRRVDPARVHSVTLAIWLGGVLVVALVLSFPRFFGALLLMVLAIAAYGAVYVFVESRMADESRTDPDDEDEAASERPSPAPARRRRTRRTKPEPKRAEPEPLAETGLPPIKQP